MAFEEQKTNIKCTEEGNNNIKDFEEQKEQQ